MVRDQSMRSIGSRVSYLKAQIVMRRIAIENMEREVAQLETHLNKKVE